MNKAKNLFQNNHNINSKYFYIPSAKLVIFLFIYSLIFINLSGISLIKDIYIDDYSLINRTSIIVEGTPSYFVEQFTQNNTIIITVEQTDIESSVPLRQETRLSKVVESINVQTTGEGLVTIAITTRDKYYLEHFFKEEDDNKIILDIYTKKEPTNIEEKKIFADFYTTVGFNERADNLNKEIIRAANINEFSGNDLITLSNSIVFPEAIKIIGSIIEERENKRLVDMSGIREPIGFDIDKIYWRSALHSILKVKNVKMEEQNGVYILTKDIVSTEKEDYADNVLIEITFFEADFNVVKEMGIDWGTVFDGKIRINADIRSTDQLTQELLTARTDRSFETGGTTIDINTLFKAFSASDKGHIISRPQITVMSGETGTVQDGIDYTILVPGRTALGDDIEQAHEVSVQSGTIVDVTPIVFLDSDNDKAINLRVKVERSTAQPDVTGFSKRTSEINSHKLLYNGEETIIGGLTTKETVAVRKGVPYLKDLPWWVLGIRYLTGHTRYQVYNKELIILIKATILPDVSERKKIGREVSEDVEHYRRQIRNIEPIFID